MIANLGPWRPDVAGVNEPTTQTALNVLPAPNGFRPMASYAGLTDALVADCAGAYGVRSTDNAPATFAGTVTALYKLNSALEWVDVTKTAGVYGVPAGDRWSFTLFGNNVIASNSIDPIQTFDLGVATRFSDLAASAPKAKYVATFGDFLLTGNLVVGGIAYGNRIQWSGVGDSTFWTIGTNQSDSQDLYSGGPVTGLVGGDTAYVFQYSQIRRVVYAPGSPEIFQIDVVEQQRGCISPGSIVQVGRQVYFRALDGFYVLDIGAGSASPIDNGKMRRWFRDELKSATDLYVLGGYDPVNRIVKWSFVSTNNSGTIPDKQLIYDLELGEWSHADMVVQGFMTYAGDGQTLESLDSFGNLDTLPYSLDSAFWNGSGGSHGQFGPDRKLGLLTGPNLAAFVETCDYRVEGGSNVSIVATTPIIDTPSASVALGVSERQGDEVMWDLASAMEATGICPQHIAAKYVRAGLYVEAGAEWTLAQNIDVATEQDGDR